jgi:hypothetical protein
MHHTTRVVPTSHRHKAHGHRYCGTVTAATVAAVSVGGVAALLVAAIVAIAAIVAQEYTAVVGPRRGGASYHAYHRLDSQAQAEPVKSVHACADAHKVRPS